MVRQAIVADRNSPVGEPPDIPTHVFERETALEPGDQITAVFGPPGSGKTFLLATWFAEFRSRGCCPTWIQLPSGCDRLGEVRSLVEEQVRGATSADTSSPQPVADPLAAVRPRDRVLFLDAVDHPDQKLVEELLDWVARVDGPPWRVILAGRSAYQLEDPAASRHQVVSFTYDDLRLSADHVVRSLGAATDLGLSERRSLADTIDGWAGAIDLVLEEIELGTDFGEVPLTGSCSAVTRYYEQEVFGDLPSSDKSFLLCSSVLPAPSVDGCEELVGSINGSARLTRLSSNHSLLCTGGEREHEFRWLPFAQQFLLQKLDEHDTPSETELRRRLVNWHAKRRHVDEAIVQGIELEEWSAVLATVVNAGPKLIVGGRAADLEAWIDEIPTEALASTPEVLALAALARWVDQGDRSASQLDDLLANASTTGTSYSRRTTSTAVLAARAAFTVGNPRTQRLLAERALRIDDSGSSPWTAVAHAALGLAAFADEEPRAARRSLTQSLNTLANLDVEPRRWMSRLLSPTLLGVLALIELEASPESDRAEALIATGQLGIHDLASPGLEVLLLARSRAALLEGDPEQALQLANKAAAEGRLESFRALAHLDAAGYHCELGQTSEAAAKLGAATELLQGVEVGRLVQRRLRSAARQTKLGRVATVSDSRSSNTLSDREREVLELLDTELSRREIAAELFLSFETVKTYVQRLYQKLGVSSRSAAVATARSWGWLDQDGSSGAGVTALPAG